MTTTTRDVVTRALADGRQALTANEARAVCEEYGIAVPGDTLATSPAEAAQAASAMGFPVVLKIVSPQILHKTEVGGVRVGLTSAEDVEQAYTEIIQGARAAVPDAEISGVQVQQQVEGGQEVIVGSVTDPWFGKLVAFGLGGVLVEVLRDVTFRLAPLADGDAQSMLESIKGGQLLEGLPRRGAVRHQGPRVDDRSRLPSRDRRPGDRRASTSTRCWLVPMVPSPSTCASRCVPSPPPRRTARPRSRSSP